MNSLMSWINGLQAHQAALLGAIIAAIVGAIASILTGLARDFAAKAWFDRRDAQKSADGVFRRYAEPLASAMTSLYWRLKEILGHDGRASFLTSLEPRTEFDQYKLRSTYYRLGAALGWLRALRRELSFLRSYGEQRLNAIDTALTVFEKSLADGHHVELQRLRGLMTLWGLQPIPDDHAELRVAVAVEQCVKHALQVAPVAAATELDCEAQAELCFDVAGIITSMANFPDVPIVILDETRSRAVRQIAIREAWLYRDWQAAIGDTLIRETKIGNRNFEVIGYGEFEDMLLGPSKAQFRSLFRIAMLFEKVDLERDHLFDARPATIRNLFEATTRMIVALAEAPASQSAIDAATAADARRVLAELPTP